jgi:hypothetical protein
MIMLTTKAPRAPRKAKQKLGYDPLFEKYFSFVVLGALGGSIALRNCYA